MDTQNINHLNISLSINKITNDKVTNDKITNDEVTNDKITNDEVTNDKITNDKITNDVDVETTETVDPPTIDNVLNNESENYKKEPWCRLDKTTKIAKINFYVNNEVTQMHNLTPAETKTLITYLVRCLDKEKLQRVKEVDYKKDCGTIKNIPALYFEKTSRKFTLKRCEKRMNTLKSLSKPKKSKKSKKPKMKTQDIPNKAE
jgi:hypothetical protein